ncbi:TonB-dependent receptor [Flavobacterium aquicola]|uniref:Iron complex outermembrane receptor protein n=1 Tax=Flavobacterium aquicola TaxID=1682742 RepID=A0A3E0ERX9_9FLAO|nr:TonB-dependent receptor [Flavobacterium aquicola]REH00140.1 iron complex outermembrane receptor protein [Flavobacterium aquicola]
MKNLFFKKNQRSKAEKTKKIFFLISCSFLLVSALSSAQQAQKDTTKVNQLDEVLVSALRVTTKTPVSFSNMSKEELAARNLGQDIPVLMNYLPSVVTTSDAGNGLGYTGIRVRGSDATRVNVTINGIPYNDSESHGTYWVNMPDFASSVQSLQLQRGVGTSTNGAGAFGASLNMLTDSYSQKSTGEISNSFGTFNTHKHTVKFSTGLMNDHFEIAGRLSALKSDGYIDRASSDLKSYFLQGTYVGKTTLIKALTFGGTEKTYQSWNGIDADKLADDRTYNSAGEFIDEFGKTRYYDNETDNYQQDHYQLHWNEKVSDNWSTNLAFHYTKGTGYYENYKYNEPVEGYGAIEPTKMVENSDGDLVPGTDLIRQKWLDNDFYGTTFSVNYKADKLDVILGGGWNKYEGDHFGKVIWSRYASKSELGDHYYDDFATKSDGNVFAKANYQLLENLSIYGDLQYRNVRYKANAAETGLVDDNFNFFNPKAGFTFNVNEKNALYFSYATANREPNRTDYEGGTGVRPEKLNDYELGWRLKSKTIQINSNVYYMKYKDQLVLTGELDDVGSPIRKNSGDSYRLGLEVDAVIKFGQKWSISPNFTLSSNKNVDFVSDATGSLVDLGNTNIAYSPDFIAGNILTFAPITALRISWLSKFVSEQYLNNIDDKSGKLKDYFVNDLNASYEIKMNSVFKSIGINVLANNIFNVDYVSNGVDYGGGYVYYFPQARANFLAGLTLKF